MQHLMQFTAVLVTVFILTILATMLSSKLYDFMTVEIYVVRHGETDKNKGNKLVYGDANLPLNKNGRREIGFVAQALPFKHKTLYTSPQKRALETAEIIAKTTQSEVIADARLRERDYSKSGRESKENQLKRVLEFIESKLRFATEELWMITHGGVIGGLLQHTGINERLPIENGSIFVFTYNKLTRKISFDRIVGCYKCLDEQFGGKILSRLLP